MTVGLSAGRRYLQHQPLQKSMQRLLQTRSKHYLLTYEYVPDILEKRTPYRPMHLEQVFALHEKKQVLLAGAFSNVVEEAGAAFVFDVDNEEEVEHFVQQDPYYQQGLVTGYKVREMQVVIPK